MIKKGGLPLADKKLGQHFLRDKKVITSICESAHTKSFDAVIEVGPGPGILTGELARSGLPLFLIEKDSRFIPTLEEFSPGERIHNTCALEFSFEGFLEKNQLKGKNLLLVSNLPYNVSVPLFLKFLKVPEISEMRLMFQKEVAQRIYSFGRDQKKMGSLKVLAQTYFDIEVLCQVPPGAFVPPPKVDSTVLTFLRKERPVLSLDKFFTFEKFLRNLFSIKRKQIGGPLKKFYGQERISSALEKNQVLPTVRAEALTLDQIIPLFQSIYS